MNYRTVVKPGSYDFEVSHQTNLMLIGSCFSENIGEKLKKGKFNTLINPFGILFNPSSIKESLLSIVNEKEFVNSDLIQENGMYHSLLHHGKFSAISSESVLKNINEKRKEATEALRKVDVLIITFGSAWTYRHINTNQIVANCHKIPNKDFKKELLDIETIVSDFRNVIVALKKINSQLKIIFTISPVRHWKDGAEENNLSKSILNVAIHQLINLEQNASYFPAYEMVIDDLRDYRFYKEDMLHPNSVAIDYVWEGFKSSFCNAKTVSLLEVIDKIKNAANHKPLNIDSSKHQDFVRNQIDKVELLCKEDSNLDFKEELCIFRNQII